MESRFKKTFLIGFILCALCIGGTFLFWPILEKLAAKTICKNLKNEIITDCEIESLHINPISHLRLKNFKLSQKNQQLLELSQLELSFDLSSILQRTVTLQTFLLHIKTINVEKLSSALQGSNHENKETIPQSPQKNPDLLSFITQLPQWEIQIPRMNIKMDQIIISEEKEKQNSIKNLLLEVSIKYFASKKVTAKLNFNVDEIQLVNHLIPKNIFASATINFNLSERRIQIENSQFDFQKIYQLQIKQFSLDELDSRICLDSEISQNFNFNEFQSLNILDQKQITLNGELNTNLNLIKTCVDKNFTSNLNFQEIALNVKSEDMKLGIPSQNLPSEVMEIDTKLHAVKNLSQIKVDHRASWKKYLTHIFQIKNLNESGLNLTQTIALEHLDQFYQAFKYQLTKVAALNLLPTTLPAIFTFKSEANLTEAQIYEIQKNPGSLKLWQSIPSTHKISLQTDSLSISKHQTKMNKLSLTGDIMISENIAKIRLDTAIFKPSFKLEEQDEELTNIEVFKNSIHFRIQNPYQLSEDLSYADFSLTSDSEAIQLESKKIFKTSIPQISNRVLLNKPKNSNSVELILAKLAVPSLGINLELKGNAKIDSKNSLQLVKSDIKLEIDSKTIDEFQENIKTKGELELLGDIQWTKGNKIKSRGKLSLKDFGFSLKEDENISMELRSANGNFIWEYSSELATIAERRNKGSIQEDNLPRMISSYLNKQKDIESSYVNPRIKLDWQSYREKSTDYNPIRIQKFKFKEFDFDNIVLDASFKEGLFNLYELSANFLSGTISTSNYLYFSDRPVSLVTELHWTNINTSKLLDNLPKVKRKAKRFLIDSDPLLSGNINLDYNFTNQEIRGAIEITKLGKEQLRMLLYFIDPFEKDKSIRHIKNALYFGSIKNVSAPIKSGLFNLNVDLELLGLPVPTPKIQNFPISNLLSNFEIAPSTSESTQISNTPSSNLQSSNEEL